MQRSEWALTVCGVGEEGCLSVHGHVALGLYIRKRTDRLSNTARSGNRTSQEG